MKIGEIAQAASTAVETIRYYEREGLLPPPHRTSANYRRYEASHLERLLMIRHCRGLGMSLDEIRELLAIVDGHTAHCGAVSELLSRHLGHVQARIQALQSLEAQLQGLLGRCSGPGALDACGMLQDLASPPLRPADQASSTVPHVHGAGDPHVLSGKC